MKIFLFTLFSLLFFTFYFNPHPIGAQTMTSPNYTIEGGNFNVTAGSKSSANYRLVDLVGQTSAQIFSSKGYLIQSGFLNRASASSLNFTITPLSLNFGLLTPNQSVYKNITLTVGSGNFPRYSVTTSQNQPLTTEAGAQIPDTLCDALKNRLCNINKSSQWKEKQSYGFGFNIKGQTVPKDFNKEENYRPFSSLSKKESAVLIMESAEKKVSHTAAIKLKLHVSPQQSVGIYQNQLNFTLSPGI